jgi:hypothetical protein
MGGHMRIMGDSGVTAPPAHGHWTGSQAKSADEDRRERRPLALALLLSVLVHALLLSLTFGDAELGLPGLALPWRERRVEVPDLRVVLVPAHVAPAEPAVVSVATTSPRPPNAPPRSGATVLSVSASPDPPRTAATNAPAAQPPGQADATQSAVADATSTVAPIRAQRPDRLQPAPIPEPAAIDLKTSDGPWSVVRAEPLSPASVIAAAPSASSVETVLPASPDPGYAAQEAQREEAVRQEAARVEAVRLEADRRETGRQAAARLEAAKLEAAQRQETAGQEAARVEIARLEAERQETARRAAAQLEAAKLETAKLEAAQQEAAQQEAAQRQQTARQEAARIQTARAEVAPPAALPHVEVEQDAAARREAVLRAIGRQLDEEAARRQEASTAAQLPNPLPYSLSTARRVRLWGRTDPNAELVQYAEAWARRIQFNTAVETIREVVKRPHTPSMVTVAVRSDGSVESVTFVVSSGVAEVDQAIRRIVESQRPYPAFPRALSRDFDVIEIRRTWYFDSGVRLQ